MRSDDMRNYDLDHSAAIHLASLRKPYSNTFRISVTLKEEISPTALEEALTHTAPRFPTIAAGIRNGIFSYRVVPVRDDLRIQPDNECFVFMPREEIRKCAARVLYGDRRISMEIFHSLTDGYGGLMFLKALVTECLSLEYGIDCETKERESGISDSTEEQELRDVFVTYAGTVSAPVNHRRVYCLPGLTCGEEKIHITTGIYDLEELRQVSRRFQVSLTELLTAVMAVSIVELEAGDQFMS